MKSITIYGLDDQASKKLNEISKTYGLSLNKTIKKIIYESLGLNYRERKDHRKDFYEFLGVWSKEDGKVFESSIRELEKVDLEDWK